MRPLRIRIPVPLIKVGVAVWSGSLRVLLPGRYSTLGNAAMSFILGENPYSVDRIRRELGWRQPFDMRTAITRSVQQ